MYFIALISMTLLLMISIGHNQSTVLMGSQDSKKVNINQSFQRRIPDTGTKVHFIQLTNGEASLIQLENGENALIDTGGHSSYTELLNYLEALRVQEIKHLILTNMKDEHSGNAQEIMKQYHVANVYYAYPFDSYVQEMVKDESVKLTALSRNDELTLSSNGKLKILHPSDQLSRSPQDHSLVFQLSLWDHIFLFTSSITDQVEKELRALYNVRSHILKVSDFGSNQASHADFLEEVDAHVAIIFHRPGFYLDADVLERLEETWMDIYPLKKHGHIIISCDEDDYELFVVESENELK